jgi:integrase
MARKNKYPGVYARWNKLWIMYQDENGKLARESSGLPIGKEKEAFAILKEIKARIRASEAAAREMDADGPITLKSYAARWVKRRQERGLSSARDEQARFDRHIVSHFIEGLPFGLMPIGDIEPVHIRDLIRDLVAEKHPDKKLAPRTIRNLYGMLHTMFIDARMERLIAANPCELPRDALPKKRDKDPLWRSSAHFSREEVEQLISDGRIPWDRRMIYGLLFLAGVRWGEMAALRWREYETDFRGSLGRLVVARSFEHRDRKIKAVKTEVPRWLPVHPTLAKMLAEWKLGGWSQMIGRAPTADDLIVPNSPVLKHSSGVELSAVAQTKERERVRDLKADDIRHCRMPQLGLKRAKDDCEKLGLRKRRNHDARRTMISLARAGGASKDLLEWVTHGPPGAVIDGYTTLPWETLCAQVLCIRIERLEGKLIALPAAGGARGRSQVGSQVLLSARAEEGNFVGRTGFGPVTSTV